MTKMRSGTHETTDGRHWDWATNDPVVAARLRQLDADYDKAVAAAANLPLAEKIEALRAARLARHAAYFKATDQ
jgi:hypothetical protein